MMMCLSKSQDGDANDEVNAKSLHDEPVCAMPSR
jgi:hypothetical protein